MHDDCYITIMIYNQPSAKQIELLTSEKMILKSSYLLNMSLIVKAKVKSGFLSGEVKDQYTNINREENV